MKIGGSLESLTKSREERKKRVRSIERRLIGKKSRAAAAAAEDGRAGGGWSERCAGDGDKFSLS